MACFHPLTAWRGPDKKIVFDRNKSFGIKLQLPCGQCRGCRLEKSRQWAIRCVHEAKMHEQNCFITLTYAPEHLPKNESLELRDFQLFMKRLRKKSKKKFAFFTAANMEINYQDLTITPVYSG